MYQRRTQRAVDVTREGTCESCTRVNCYWTQRMIRAIYDSTYCT